MSLFIMTCIFDGNFKENLESTFDDYINNISKEIEIVETSPIWNPDYPEALEMKNQKVLKGSYTISQKSTNRFLDAYLDSNFYNGVTRTLQNNDTQEWLVVKF